jgi:hypothetical protein
MNTITETVSVSEIESRKTDGWTLIRIEPILGRTAVMSKEGSPTAWLDEHARIISESRASMTKTQRRIASRRDYLRNRGMDV